tara:strand:+ start:11889 stop:12458 length:570 start_codon:yes stop_codon:yes gene_type:complete
VKKNYFYSSDELKKIGIKCGKNCNVHSSVIISNKKNLTLGNNVRIDSNCVFISAGKIKLENFIHVTPFCYLHSNLGNKIIIKSHAGLSSGVKIYTSVDDYSGKEYYSPFNEKIKKTNSQITINKYCIVGPNSIVVPGSKIGVGTVVGPFSYVNKLLDSWSIYSGFPLKKYSNRKKNFLKKVKIIENKKK